ncbi:hypothetical protein E2C01_030038 [Portunus trituberculatus]|uniref:Uncharacterized protein n=1 Tax=Portunus trituberculatus TaxID=210409 RepID=A0A5B7ET51_PORTR|nr:hypothetical protein [Portunus trituberculatus]
MSSKQPATPSAGGLKAKRPRKNLSIEKKLDIVIAMKELGSQFHHQNPAVGPLHCLHHHQTSSNIGFCASAVRSRTVVHNQTAPNMTLA